MHVTERRLSLKHGSEGPRHDPYAYTEYTVRVNGEVHTLHLGLAEWYAKNEKRNTHYDPYAIQKFEAAIGFTLVTFNKAIDRFRYPDKCRKCNSRDINWRSGFPGEELLVCEGCGAILASDFNESAIV